MKRLLQSLVIFAWLVPLFPMFGGDAPPAGTEIECPSDEHPNLVSVSVPVPAPCPHKSGQCVATVFDYTSKPANGEKPVTKHCFKSVSPCACKVQFVICECIPNGVYQGVCTAAADGKSSVCVYQIPCKDCKSLCTPPPAKK